MHGGTIAWHEDADAGEVAEVGDIEDAVMGFAVRADEAGAIDRKDNGDAWEADVVSNLIVRALEKRGIDPDDRAEAARRHARGKSDSVLFGDADVDEAIWVFLGEASKPHAGAHRGGDDDDPGIVFRALTKRFGEDISVGFAFGGWLALARAHRKHAVVFLGIMLGGGIAFAFAGEDMKEHGHVGFIATGAQEGDELVHVVAIDGTKVMEAEVFEDILGRDDVLDTTLDALKEGGEPPADERDVEKCGTDLAFEVTVALIGDDAAEVSSERTDRGRDRHTVVVEHDEKFADTVGVIEAFEGEPAGESAIANDSDDMLVTAG